MSYDRYEDLLDLELGQALPKEQLTELSTLFPILAEWFAVFGAEAEYYGLRRAVDELFAHTDLQVWYPDDRMDDALYSTNAGYGTGAMYHSIELPERLDELSERMRRLLQERNAFDRMTCTERGLPALALVASRHFRTPVLPAFWQGLLDSARGQK